MTDFICKKCGSTEYEIKDKPNGTGIAHGLYCAKCDFWHKWLGKEELKQYATKESKDEIIAKLQSENAELRERLKKAVELPCKVGDTVWCIRAYGKGYQIEENSVIEIVFEYGNNMKIKTSRGLFGYDKWTYGLDCFTDRAKAEAELKGGKG